MAPDRTAGFTTFTPDDDDAQPLERELARRGVVFHSEGAFVDGDGNALTVESSDAGLLEDMPDAATVAAGFRYFATDDNGGTEYISTGAAWVIVGPRATERARTTVNVDDSLRPVGFAIAYGQAANGGTSTPAQTSLKVSWTSRGLPVIVRGRLPVRKDATAANYLWGYIDTLGDTSLPGNIVSYPDFRSAPANSTNVLRPESRFDDPAGTVRTVGIGVNSPAGGYTPLAISALEVIER